MLILNYNQNILLKSNNKNVGKHKIKNDREFAWIFLGKIEYNNKMKTIAIADDITHWYKT